MQKSFTSVLAKAHGIVSTFRDLDHDGLIEDVFAQFTSTDDDFYTLLTRALVQPNGNKLFEALALSSSATATSSPIDRNGRARLLLQAINDVSVAVISSNDPSVATPIAVEGGADLVVTIDDDVVALQEPGSTEFGL